MPQAATKRFCIIRPNGGLITVRLQANNTLIVGGKLGVFDAEGTSLGQFQMQTDASGIAMHQIDIPAERLQNCRISWSLLCCAMVATFDHATVTMDFLQDGGVCPLTKAAQWALTDVEACDNPDNTATQIKGAADFLHSS